NAGAQDIFSTSAGVIKFKSDAALELIKASSGKLSGAVDLKKKTFAFYVDISSFEGFNSLLQREHFNEIYMESAEYKSASFSGKFIEDLDFTSNGKYMVRAKGILNIHGVEQERIIKCE